MKSFRTAVGAALSVALIVSCSKGATINGTVKDAPESDIVVSMLDVNKYKVLDTVKTSSTGAFKYSVEVEKGQPQFIYLFKDGKRIGSMLVRKGEKIQLTTDTQGHCSVTGSPESAKLLQVEGDQADFANSFASLAAKLADLPVDSPEAAQARRDLTKQYISYYRSRVKYVMENPKSLTVIPVLYQDIEGTPVFGQATDVIHFRNCRDSLLTVYPDSKYVKALSEEVNRRENIFKVNSKMREAQQAGFVDLSLPDAKGEKVSLSSVKGKVVMVYFWRSGATEQKMFNLDVMKPIYDAYHPKGLEIYAVSLDTDKTTWATVVRTQQLPWVNVCDGLGMASPAAALYNVGSVPTVYFIVDGDMDSGASVSDEASLRRYLSGKLG